MGVSFPRLNEIINRKRGVTPDTALRLARVTGMSADFWLGLQQDWDLWHAMRSDKAKEIEDRIRGFFFNIAFSLRTARGSR